MLISRPMISAAPSQRKNSEGLISASIVAVVSIIPESLGWYFESTLPKKPFSNIIISSCNKFSIVNTLNSAIGFMTA